MEILILWSHFEMNAQIVCFSEKHQTYNAHYINSINKYSQNYRCGKCMHGRIKYNSVNKIIDRRNCDICGCTLSIK